MAIEVDATLWAGKGALLRMTPLVQQQAELQAEAAATLRAAEGPLTGVRAPMAAEPCLVSKALGAVRTRERALRAVVDSQVICESRGVREGPGAVRAGGGCLTSMVLGGAAQVWLCGKVLRALGTGNRVLRGVATLVGQQHVLGKTLATMVAEYLLPDRRRQWVASQLSECHLSLGGLGQVRGCTAKRCHGCGLLAFECHI